MQAQKREDKTFSEVPPWIFIGAIIVLLPIFTYITIDNINRKKTNRINILLEKGAALIRSFEAGTRTGILGDLWGTRQLQKLLYETAQQPDIKYILVADSSGSIIAHSDPVHTGSTVNIKGNNKPIDPKVIARTKDLLWHIEEKPDGIKNLIIFRKFEPTGGEKTIRWKISKYRDKLIPDAIVRLPMPERIIFVSLDMKSVDESYTLDIRESIVTSFFLLLSCIAGVVILFMIQRYKTTRSSFYRIRAFSEILVENMPIGMFAMDGEKNIVTFNTPGKKILNLDDKNSPVIPHDLLTLLNKLNAKRDIIETDIDCTLDNQAIVPLEVSASYLWGKNFEKPGFVCLFKDLSEVRFLKKEVERSQRLASVGKLAAGVAHEIRNPLSSIKGFATYFKERYQDVPEDQKIADIMINEVDRLNRVVGHLLEFARPVMISLQPVDLKTFMENSITLVKQRAENENITIHFFIEDDIKTAMMDPDRISQLLLNLYINAIDAMHGSDQGVLEVTVKKVPNKKFIIISVKDTGEGIAEEDLAHIFDPYFTTKSSGTGLGLAISHNIIDAHNGIITISSEKHLGTTIAVSLPHRDTETGKENDY